jgi:hypothetical protein
MFTFLYETLLEINPILAVLITFSIPIIALMLVPGDPAFKIGFSYWIVLVMMRVVEVTPVWLYVLYAVVGGLAFGLAVYKVIAQ